MAARERKALLALQDELGHEIGVTRHAIDKWRQGHVPSDSSVIAKLARACVRRGGMDRQWLRRFLTQAHFPGQEVLTAKLFPGEDEDAPTVRHNLPRRPYERFIGRERELAELRRFLSPRHRVGVVSINGAAGVGKTALALEMAHRFREEYPGLPPDECFEAIVWVTAKRTELLPKGPAPRRPTFTDLDGLYRALAEVLNRPAITRAANREEQDVIVARLLVEQRVLLVLDNLEDVDDPALMVFLRDLPAPSKAIVTTRHRIDVAAPVHLRAFNEHEAQELIRSECQRHRLTLTEEQQEKLLQRTGGLPLAIGRTIGRMAWRGSSVEAELRQLGDPTSDIYDFCFEKSIALIRGRDAHRLFMALSLFATDASRAALGHVAGFNEDVLSRDEGLSDLEVLSLVSKEGNRFSLDPLTKYKARAELAAHVPFAHEARERWIAWYRMLAEQAEDPTHYPDLRPEMQNMLGVMEWLAEEGRMADVGWFFQQIQYCLFAEGLWGPLLDFAERVTAWVEVTGDVGTLVAALQSAINVFRRQGAFARGEEWLERVQIAAVRTNNDLLQAEVWLARGRLLYSQNSYSEGTECLSRALKTFQKLGKVERVIWTLNSLGNLFRRKGDLEKAAHFYRQGLRVVEETAHQPPKASWWQAVLRGNLGIVAGRQGRYAEACKILYEVLDHLTEQADFAEAYAILAYYEHQLGHVEQACLLRRRADRIIGRLGLARPLCEEDAEWMRRHEETL